MGTLWVPLVELSRQRKDATPAKTAEAIISQALSIFLHGQISGVDLLSDKLKTPTEPNDKTLSGHKRLA
jgi:hypothetical protein